VHEKAKVVIDNGKIELNYKLGVFTVIRSASGEIVSAGDLLVCCRRGVLSRDRCANVRRVVG